MAEQRNNRQSLQGTVTSAKAMATVTVEVERTFRHPRYGKFVRRKKNYLVHDAEGVAREGDLVEIVACRPMSKRKRYRIAKVIEHGDLGLQGISPDAELAEAAAAEGGES